MTKSFFALVFLLCISLGATAQDDSPTYGKSIGINLPDVLQGNIPDVLFLKKQGKRTFRLRAGLTVQKLYEFRELDASLSTITENSFLISPNVAWGYQWGKEGRIASFYYGFEGRAEYTYNPRSSSQVQNDTLQDIVAFYDNEFNSYQIGLGAAAVLGGRFKLGKRFSLCFETDFSAMAYVQKSKLTRNQSITTMGVTDVQPEFISEEVNYTTRLSAMPTIRLFLNFHF